MGSLGSSFWDECLCYVFKLESSGAYKTASKLSHPPLGNCREMYVKITTREIARAKSARGHGTQGGAGGTKDPSGGQPSIGKHNGKAIVS